MRRKPQIFIFIIGIFLLSSCVTNQKLPNMPVKEGQIGSIFFRVIGEGDRTPGGGYKSYILDMSDKSIQLMGYNNSNVGQAISNDGKLIAVTCYDNESEICILSTSAIINKNSIVPESDKVGYGYLLTDEDMRLSLPDDCVKNDSQNSPHQMSWSYDNKKISIICGEKLVGTILCIVGLDGNSKCFPETANKKIIYAAYSPKEDILAVSSTTYSIDPPITFLFDPETEEFQQLFSGFSPAWSPSGERIASFFVNKFDKDYYGLQVYSLEKKKNITLLPNKQSKLAGFFVWPTVAERVEECSITWSLDEKQLVFSTRFKGWGFSTLILYDFRTGNIQYLLDPDLFLDPQINPQWIPYEITKD